MKTKHFIFPSKFACLALIITCAVTSLFAGETNAPLPVAVKPATVTVQELIKDANNYDGQEVVLEGFVTDYCKRKGCWALLHDKDSDAKGIIKVQQDEEGPTFKPFLPELQGKTILVTGKVHATKVDTNYLDKWESRVNSAKTSAAEDKDKVAAQAKAKEAVLKQIATLRDRLANSKKGYLTSISFAVNTWQPKSELP